MKANELLRKLRRLGATVNTKRGKGGHVQVRLGDKVQHVPTGSKDLKEPTLAGILKDLGLTRDDIRNA